uniref:Glutamine-dependent NAD(+) synthetase n=2 Tax=Tetraselmis sp. GSL018 TaxID=582737 RepID=A0A061S1R4_9CHLO|mmetsp:Transcript_13269/g.31415  ORF Transcript_13269/g.31415 Transcript_13269/m.31415 type:complete len:704 (-) Transcript_13269:105-2216(-)
MRQRHAVLATCNLNQWAMDFKGNLERVIQSIELSKKKGATYRLGPELELPGYGCEDHFAEQDTVEHSWECLQKILEGGYTSGIVCDIGMPVVHAGVRYNCRVFCLDGRILLIRPKMYLANDGNYRETRYFATWKRLRTVEDFYLPVEIAESMKQRTCPIGDATLTFNDLVLGSETCEELFTPDAPHIQHALNGVEVIANGSGSHHQLRKLNQRLDLMKSGTAKAGGVYLYANQKGCDGSRLYFDGCACALVNGHVVEQGSQFSLSDVEVVVATVDVEEVVSYRGSICSLREQASSAERIPTVVVDFSVCRSSRVDISLAKEARYLLPEEEIAYGPACWLWDYMRRSGASGFLLPLSGGADSSSTAAITGFMCQLAVKAIAEGDKNVEADARRIGQYGDSDSIDDPRELANRIFVTVYMGTVNSSTETQERSKRLADEIGSYHLTVKIDSVVSALSALFTTITGKTPRFRSGGGSVPENLALQNIQARIRMVLAFMLAQLMNWVRGRSGFLLVLGSANVDEGLRGYLTKYDCSSADINPIGGISKGDLKSFLLWGAKHLGYPSLQSVVEATPTAELEPLSEGQIAQTDEADMGMTYEELGVFGRLRKISRCGPVSMFRSLLVQWKHCTPTEVAEKVKHFFRHYSINRHKMTTITPSYHAENYSPDDNRFDHRQFLYRVTWPWQFARIDELPEKAEGKVARPPAS